MEQYFANKRCLPHGGVCVGVNLIQNTDINEKLQCLTCILMNPRRTNEIQQVESIVQTVKEMECIKSEIIEKYYTPHFLMLNQYIRQFEQFQKYIQETLLEINESLNNAKFQFTKQLLNLENITDNEMNKLLEIAINKNKKKLSYRILEHESKLIQKFQQQVEQQLKLINGIEPFIKSLIQKINNILNWNSSPYSDELQKDTDSVSESENEIEQIQQNLVTQEISQNTFKIYYESKSQIDSQDFYSLDINKDNSLIACGGYGQIVIYCLNNDSMQKVFSTIGHSSTISCIKFSKKNNSFFTGSYDKIIRIWTEISQKQKWKCQRTIKAHNYFIDFIQFNKDEEELIVACGEVIIILDNQGKQLQILKGHTGNIQQLDYNQDESQFVSCEKTKIIIWQKNVSQNKWIKSKMISNLDNGQNVCFLMNSVIAFQERNFSSINLYQINQIEEGVFQQIKLNNLQNPISPKFCLIFNHQKNLLFTRCDKFLYVIQVDDQNNQFKVIQNIEFQDGSTIGTVSSDGIYFITYNWKQKQLQLMKYSKLMTSN